jgi:hypothetical protein
MGIPVSQLVLCAGGNSGGIAIPDLSHNGGRVLPSAMSWSSRAS